MVKIYICKISKIQDNCQDHWDKKQMLKINRIWFAVEVAFEIWTPVWSHRARRKWIENANFDKSYGKKSFKETGQLFQRKFEPQANGRLTKTQSHWPGEQKAITKYSYCSDDYLDKGNFP